MKIFRSWTGQDPAARGASVALGNFDGVHRGHHALIRRAAAAVPGAPLGVVTFEPHPRQLFQPETKPFRLTTQDERARALESLGVDRVFEINFDAALAGMKADGFAEQVLAKGLGVLHVVIGSDFRFGKGRAGTPERLRALGERLGFGVSVEPMHGDGTWSSTAIRAALAEGDCATAACALGRWHAVSGPVSQGDQRGRDLGYPTANLAFGLQLTPRFGVYASRVTVHDGPHAGRYDGVASIGERPTFGVNRPNFEVHLFDFSGDLYGASISAALIAFLRPEARFDTVESLIIQMDRDSADARSVLATAPEVPE
ncbi:MAG: bifunctional riboflavin kinase/FAD synthetase [Pseudomonadota bacterium]